MQIGLLSLARWSLLAILARYIIGMTMRVYLDLEGLLSGYVCLEIRLVR
jgi:hypothetical protein